MKALLRRSLVTVIGSVTLLFASTAFAEGEPCYNDTDCPGGGGNVCGGDVCNWSKMSATGTMDKPFYCNAAGTQPKGMDGWCTTADNCKCKGAGAKCVGTYCTFTKASDAPAGTGGTGAGGTSSTAGTTSTAGTGTAGTGTAGTGTAGTGTSGGGSSDSGGCSVGSATNTGGGIALALGALGLGIALSRRRR